MEAVKIADIVHEAGMATAVDEAAECASACFIIFAAGIGKFAHYGARIGLNGASGASSGCCHSRDRPPLQGNGCADRHHWQDIRHSTPANDLAYAG
jgi:hypothetical protein